MKRLFVSMLAVLLVSLTASAITINKALLQHNDQVTLFDGDKIQDAVNAAVDGDIIYLTLGTFKPFDVTKKITIRGTGETSVIDGNVNISIPGSAKLTSPVLEALAVSGTVNIGAQVDDIIIRKCKITNFTIGAQIDGAVIDRCYITEYLTLSSYIKSMTVVNSKLSRVQANSEATQNTTFVNCNMSIITGCFSATIINSIIYATYSNSLSSSYNSSLSSSVVLNTLYGSNYCSFASSSVLQNCYPYSSSINLTKEQLQSNDYLGTDGTVVGIYGGDTPYTLEPSVPKVTSSALQLDMEQKKLNVKLTVSPQ